MHTIMKHFHSWITMHSVKSIIVHLFLVLRRGFAKITGQRKAIDIVAITFRNKSLKVFLMHNLSYEKVE